MLKACISLFFDNDAHLCKKTNNCYLSLWKQQRIKQSQAFNLASHDLVISTVDISRPVYYHQTLKEYKSIRKRKGQYIKYTFISITVCFVNGMFTMNTNHSTEYCHQPVLSCSNISEKKIDFWFCKRKIA